MGALLHDIGKVIYRSGDHRTHSRSGHDFLKDELGITDQDVLQAVLYHHRNVLRNAPVAKDSLAYITYIADHIAANADRRKKESDDCGFEMSFPLQPVFNLLNGNQKQFYYHPGVLDEKINYPTSEKNSFDKGFYEKVELLLKEALNSPEWTTECVNSLLEVLEIGLSYVPSSTAKDEPADISMFDHVKMTAAIGSCVYQYLLSQGQQDFKAELFENTDSFYGKEVFLLFSIDLSGIQSFIYTIHSKDALKMLRARSFYLEIMMEHIIDVLLERVSLSRANRIYSGGGHAYLLLPNTESVKAEIAAFEQDLNQWFLEQFDIALYAASAYTPASADALQNIPDGSYAKLFQAVSQKLGEKKRMRYTPGDIVRLNTKQHQLYDRECRVCRRLGRISEDELCDICEALKESSRDILEAPFFVVLKDYRKGSLPLPGGYHLIAESKECLLDRMQAKSSSFVRAYAKNNMYFGMKNVTRVWVGNYTNGQTFEELAETSEGIQRIGVLRADVDNLGQTFVAGFQGEYSMISRTATLSRQLSLFFKYYMNHLLKGRNISIVYSGGDDVFLVGAWNEVMEFAVYLAKEFERFTEGTLSISAGEGVYHSSYPIHQIALEVGELEEDAKGYPGKSAFTILPDGEVHKDSEKPELELSDGTYSWAEFEQNVSGEKLLALKQYLADTPERGNAYLYHLLELIRGRKEKINFARYVYLISRMEPDQDASEEKKDAYRRFSRQMYEWMKSPKDCRELKTAITIYLYLTREKGETEDGDQ
ncbi:MAG: type III-A CRISPR-associated protein Cas10/Csm1 [Lachnospiraceae bacterium]|nr:type III-A CRISPR-associated protein Cas10/Csm1 [Lachnospiraceae bacterium]